VVKSHVLDQLFNNGGQAIRTVRSVGRIDNSTYRKVKVTFSCARAGLERRGEASPLFNYPTERKCSFNLLEQWLVEPRNQIPGLPGSVGAWQACSYLFAHSACTGQNFRKKSGQNFWNPHGLNG